MNSISKGPRKISILAWVIFGIIACAVALGLASYFTLKTVTLGSSKGYGSSAKSAFFDRSPKLVRLDIKGVIFESEEIEKVYEALDQLENSQSIKGVLVRISSPGGSVAPTQEIFNRLMKLREKVPVICSLGDVAASGGYYIASACHKIFVNSGTLTGSIGVIMQLANLKDLYQWAKIKPFVLKAGQYKDMGSPFKDISDEEKALFQGMLDQLHSQFKTDIAKGRGNLVKDNSIEKYADGRIFSGEQAVSYGLADELGGLKEAIGQLRKEAKVSDEVEIVTWPEKENDFRLFFKNQFKTLSNALKIERIVGVETGLALDRGVPYFLPHFYAGNRVHGE